MTHYNLCGFTNHNGKDCMSEVPESFPVNLCVTHLIKAGKFYEDTKFALLATRRREVKDAPTRTVVTFDQSTPEPPQHDYTPEAKDQGLVYYVRFSGLIKIGYTQDLRGRLNNLAWEEVLALEPGSMEHERSRHQKFKEHLAARREWFTDCTEIREHIARVRERFPHLSRLADRYTNGEVKNDAHIAMEEPTIPHSVKTTLSTGATVIDKTNFRQAELDGALADLMGIKFN